VSPPVTDEQAPKSLAATATGTKLVIIGHPDASQADRGRSALRGGGGHTWSRLGRRPGQMAVEKTTVSSSISAICRRESAPPRRRACLPPGVDADCYPPVAAGPPISHRGKDWTRPRLSADKAQ